MKIELIKIRSIPVTIGVGKFSFPIENGIVQHNESSKVGCETVSNEQLTKQLKLEYQPNALKEYFEAFDLAVFAWNAQLFDTITNNE